MKNPVSHIYTERRNVIPFLALFKCPYNAHKNRPSFIGLFLNCWFDVALALQCCQLLLFWKSFMIHDFFYQVCCSCHSYEIVFIFYGLQVQCTSPYVCNCINTSKTVLSYSNSCNGHKQHEDISVIHLCKRIEIRNTRERTEIQKRVLQPGFFSF